MSKFDPIVLREKRLAALRAAQIEPILTKLPSTSSGQRVVQDRYPFVFDSQLDAQAHVSILKYRLYLSTSYFILL